MASPPRMSTRLMRLRQARPGSSGVKDRDMEDTIQELEARVAMLESQKGALQNKLSLAKQHIMDLGGRTPYKFSKGTVRNIAHERKPGWQLLPRPIVELPPSLLFFFSPGKSMEVEVGVRRAAQTAPPRYGPTFEDTRAEMERL